MPIPATKVKPIDEGYVKFKCHLTVGAPPKAEQLTGLNRWRDRLYGLGLIGMYSEGPAKGIGFGNISIRSGSNLIVSGTKTGQYDKLSPEQYVLVTGYSLENNSVECVGKIEASSETMTHAAIYQAAPQMNAVIHIHNLESWEALLNKIPTTKDVPYGTPEMAKEMIRLLGEPETMKQRIIVMAGHKEGIITFGKDLDEAGQVILDKVVPLLRGK